MPKYEIDIPAGATKVGVDVFFTVPPVVPPPPPPPPVASESPAGTSIRAGETGFILDKGLARWTLNRKSQTEGDYALFRNGAIVTNGGAFVTEVIYEGNNTFYQKTTRYGNYRGVWNSNGFTWARVDVVSPPPPNPVPPSPPPPPPPPGRFLTFSDDFSGPTLDAQKWASVPRVIGNGFSADNILFRDGKLVLRGRRTPGTNNWTTAAIETQNTPSFFKQEGGRWEIRFKAAKGPGTLSSLWMLFVDPALPGERWPICGEIDVIEVIGAKPNMAQCTIHRAKPGTAERDLRPDYTVIHNHSAPLYEDFHTYGCEWNIDGFVFDFDGRVIGRSSIPGGEFPFNRPFFPLITHMTGVDPAWRGVPTADMTETEMVVEYFKVWE